MTVRKPSLISDNGIPGTRMSLATTPTTMSWLMARSMSSQRRPLRASRPMAVVTSAGWPSPKSSACSLLRSRSRSARTHSTPISESRKGRRTVSPTMSSTRDFHFITSLQMGDQSVMSSWPYTISVVVW